jgi:hypothetical protein
MNASQCRHYAEECRRLARNMPEYREVLLAMAADWDAVAEQLERDGTNRTGKLN